jgi:DNA-binding transcriptional LysR family regulator
LQNIHARNGEIMDLLAALKTFVAVTEIRSFSAVARRENSSQSAVTRRIAELEAHFGVRLLHRTTRRLSLTPDGEDLLAHAQQVLGACDDMESSLGAHRTEPVGHVRLAAPVGFGIYLAAHLHHLLARHPRLSVELVMSDESQDMIDGRIDLAIRVRALDDSSLVIRQIGEVAWLTVAAPEYIAARGTPDRPQDLASHACLLHSAARGGIWRLNGPDGPVDVHVTSRFSANVLDAVRQMALGGFGIALLPEIMIADDLAAGHLLRVLTTCQAPTVPVYLVTPTRRHLPPRTRVVMDFLIEITSPLRDRRRASPVFRAVA